MKTVKSFLFLGSKITVDGYCSHEMKRRLLLGRKVMTNLGSIFKSRDTILSTKICRVKPMVFPVVMCRCESWTIKKGEHQRIDAFKLWCWKILLRVPWTGGRNKSVNYKENQPWIFIGRIDTEAEARIVCPPDVKSQLIGKDLDRLRAGERGDRGWDSRMVSPTQWPWVWANSKIVKDGEA